MGKVPLELGSLARFPFYRAVLSRLSWKLEKLRALAGSQACEMLSAGTCQPTGGDMGRIPFLAS